MRLGTVAEAERRGPCLPRRPLQEPYFAALAFAASHLAWVISRKPLPLQEFCPLQELLALLQADLPLQEFTPSHFTFASSAALAVVTAAIEKTIAAAAARATPDIFREFIRDSPRSLGHEFKSTWPARHAQNRKACIAPGDSQALGGALYAFELPSKP